MNAFNMTCEAVDATLPDYLDETLEPWLRTAVEEHLRECVRCTGLVRDLRNIQREAAALPDIAPAHDLWTDIAPRIGTPVVLLPPVAASPAPVAVSQPEVAASQTAPIAARRTGAAHNARAHDRDFGPMKMSLAAAALVVVTASTTYLLTVASLRPAGPPNVATAVSSPKPAASDRSNVSAGVSDRPLAPPAVGSDSSDAALAGTPQPVPSSDRLGTASMVSQPRPSPADPVYENEVKKLQAIMSWRKAQLNPSTAAIIEHNLRIIDGAIAQSKEALRNDPASPMLSDQLTHALDKKVGLLRRAAMLAPST